ncbi:MAG: MFS transporter [Cyanobacteria bacterium P01_A01_bin.135]
MANFISSPCDEGVIRARPCDAKCQARAKPWILAATILGSSIVFIGSTVVNVALPTLQQQLGATVSQVQWVVESYALLLGALILLGGALGDRFGRRRLFVLGLALFALASAACGFAADINQLIVARGVQGIGGALLTPGSLAIISASFPAEERGGAIGLWSGFTAITAAIGPVLGGWLIETVSWRWIFWLNLPLAAVAIAIGLWRVPESRDPGAAKRLDRWGALLAVLGLGSLVYGLLESANLGLGHPLILGAIAVGVGLLGAFVWVEAEAVNPMMPLALFRSRAFTGANLLTLLLYAALGGALFFLPFNLIQVQGYSATAAGAALAPLPVIIFLLSRWSGGLVGQYGARRPLVIGPAIAAVGFALMLIPGVGGSYWTTFFPAVAILGLGMAVSVAPLTTTVMAAVETRYVGVASGVNNAVSRVASLLAVALFGIVMLAMFGPSLATQLAALNLAPDAQQSLLAQSGNLAAIEIPTELDPDARQAVADGIAIAFVSGFRAVMGLAAALAALSAVAAALLIPSPSSRPRPTSIARSA